MKLRKSFFSHNTGELFIGKAEIFFGCDKPDQHGKIIVNIKLQLPCEEQYLQTLQFYCKGISIAV